ncbi:MAG: valine--tRNA ligase [Candidatus Diapherotrites archaeon]
MAAEKNKTKSANSSGNAGGSKAAQPSGSAGQKGAGKGQAEQGGQKGGSRLNLQEMEKKWRAYWEKQGIYNYRDEAQGQAYAIDTPPPTVSGKMHLGHAFSYTQADVIARYKKMRGFNVFYPFGLDDNGLATERLVEKNRNVRAKDIGRDAFIKVCLDETKKVEEGMRSDFYTLGLACDWKQVYRTIDDKARRAAQLSFLDIYGKGRAYRREAPTMWCPRCETAIAQAELEDKEQEADFFYITFNVKGGKEKVTIATTRPELMPACVAIHVHPEDKRYKNLVGKEVEIPFMNRAVKVWANPKVAMDFGTGAVYHCTFGDLDDVEWIMAFNIPVIEIMGRDGVFNGKAGVFKGLRVSEARKKIVDELQKAGHLAKTEKIRNVLNVHERCKTPVEILTSRQWFVKLLDLKDELLARAEQVKWHPGHMRVRYNHWVKGLKWDWCISRQRFFGVPIPVWYCKKCGAVMLADAEQLPVDPLAQKPKGKCKCGSAEFEPEKDVFDTWFTSSLTPEIACAWKDNEKRFRKLFPMGLRPQAHDIINLWAFYTIVKAHMHEGKVPWKDIMICGHALDPKGRKMGKSTGNVIEPVEMINKYSTDVLRYWSCAGTLGEDIPFQEKEMVAGQKFMTKIYNAAGFVNKVADVAGFDAKKTKTSSLKFMPSDLWIMSRLNSVKRDATSALEKYEFSRAMHAIRNFFWLEFADFYIEEAKWRVYDAKNPSQKAAQYVLCTTFTDTVKMLAPFMPHITEEIYREIFKGKMKSVHLEEWPAVDEKWINAEAEETGKVMAAVIGEARKEKSRRNIALNSEVKKVSVTAKDKKTKAILDNPQAAEEIRKTMNILALEVKLDEKQESRVGIRAEF